MKKLFEKWVITTFGEDFKKPLEDFDEENGYGDKIINAMWIGFNGYAILNGQV